MKNKFQLTIDNWHLFCRRLRRRRSSSCAIFPSTFLSRLAMCLHFFGAGDLYTNANCTMYNHWHWFYEHFEWPYDNLNSEINLCIVSARSQKRENIICVFACLLFLCCYRFWNVLSSAIYNFPLYLRSFLLWRSSLFPFFSFPFFSFILFQFLVVRIHNKNNITRE